MGLMTYFGNIYDKNTGSIIYKDSMGVLTFYDDIMCMSTPRESEIHRYNLSRKLKKVDKRYLKNLYKSTYKNMIKNEEKENEIINSLSSNITADRVISDEKLKKYEDEYNIPYDELLKIRDDVQEALNNNDINTDKIITRFEFLIDTLDEDLEDTIVDDYCEFCHDFSFKNGVCQVCGYNHFDKKIEEIKKQIESEYDERGVYYSLIDEINKENLDFNKVFDAQLEIASNSFLNFLDNFKDYTFLPDIDDENGISEETFVKFLVDNKYIELIENSDKNDEKEFLYNLKINNQIPTLRTYKSHMHRDYIYRINKKGRRYYKQNKCTNIYLKYIHHLPYYDFKEYYDQNKALDKKVMLKNYLKLKEEEAVKEDNIEKYCNIAVSKALLPEDDIETKVTDIIQSVICGLNSYILKQNIEPGDNPISTENTVLIEEYMEILEEYYDEEIFDRAYESIKLDKLKFDKDERFTDVTEIIGGSVGISNNNLRFKYSEYRM